MILEKKLNTANIKVSLMRNIVLIELNTLILELSEDTTDSKRIKRHKIQMLKICYMSGIGQNVIVYKHAVTMAVE